MAITSRLSIVNQRNIATSSQLIPDLSIFSFPFSVMGGLNNKCLYQLLTIDTFILAYHHIDESIQFTAIDSAIGKITHSINQIVFLSEK